MDEARGIADKFDHPVPLDPAGFDERPYPRTSMATARYPAAANAGS